MFHIFLTRINVHAQHYTRIIYREPHSRKGIGMEKSEKNQQQPSETPPPKKKKQKKTEIKISFAKMVTSK